jgi:hypothetical protein
MIEDADAGASGWQGFGPELILINVSHWNRNIPVWTKDTVSSPFPDRRLCPAEGNVETAPYPAEKASVSESSD